MLVAMVILTIVLWLVATAMAWLASKKYSERTYKEQPGWACGVAVLPFFVFIVALIFIAVR